MLHNYTPKDKAALVAAYLSLILFACACVCAVVFPVQRSPAPIDHECEVEK